MTHKFAGLQYWVCAFALIIGVGSQVVAHHLDEATAKQCANHDWPKHQHDAHIDFCKAYGYKTN